MNLISFVIVVAYELANDRIDDHFFQFSIRWAQIFTDGRMPLECGTGQRLILTNVTYEQQGQYICLASNKINGNVREVKSDPVSLQVVGAPRVRRLDNTSTNHVNLIQFFSRIAIAFFKILINILPSSYEKNEINLASLSRDGKSFFFFLIATHTSRATRLICTRVRKDEIKCISLHGLIRKIQLTRKSNWTRRRWWSS